MMRARIVVLVDSVAEAHQLNFAGLHPLDVVGDVGHRADFVEHPQCFFIGAAVQRACQRSRCRRHGEIRISFSAAYDAHGGGAAVLLVIGVQDEQNIEGAGDHGAGDILRLCHAPKHVHEVLGVAEIVVRINERMTHAVPVRVRRQGRHFGNQADNLLLPDFAVANVPRFRIDSREGRQRTDENPHWMRVVTEAIDEVLDGLVQHGVEGDVVHPFPFTLVIGELAVEQQISDLEEGAIFGQVVDVISAITEYALVAINVGDCALAIGRVHEGGIVRHETKIVGVDFDLAEVHRANGFVLDGHFVCLISAVVSNGQSVLGHDLFLLLAYVASLPVDASDLEAPGLVSVEEDLVSDAGADEGLVPFPPAAGGPDFLA